MVLICQLFAISLEPFAVLINLPKHSYPCILNSLQNYQPHHHPWTHGLGANQKTYSEFHSKANFPSYRAPLWDERMSYFLFSGLFSELPLTISLYFFSNDTADLFSKVRKAVLHFRMSLPFYLPWLLFVLSFLCSPLSQRLISLTQASRRKRSLLRRWHFSRKVERARVANRAIAMTMHGVEQSTQFLILSIHLLVWRTRVQAPVKMEWDHGLLRQQSSFLALSWRCNSRISSRMNQTLPCRYPGVIEVGMWIRNTLH